MRDGLTLLSFCIRIKFRVKTGKDIEAVLADKTSDRKGGHAIFYELHDSTILPPEEKTVKRLQDEATLLIMAGTESTAKSMTIATFYALWLPAVLDRLHAELLEAGRNSLSGELSLSTLLTLPYLSAIIHEANRLSFGVTTRLSRYSRTETLTYTASSGPCKDTTYVLPLRTVMSSNTYCNHTNGDVFPEPWTFDPERWFTEREGGNGNTPEQVNRRKRSLMSLGKGYRRCIGMNLANAELCLQLATLTEYDMSLFETDESDVKSQYDYQISHPRLDSKGLRVVVEGRHTL